LWHTVTNDNDVVPNWTVYFLIIAPLSGRPTFRRVGMAKNNNPWRGGRPSELTLGGEIIIE
jgi:hypothetical protein